MIRFDVCCFFRNNGYSNRGRYNGNGPSNRGFRQNHNIAKGKPMVTVVDHGENIQEKSTIERIFGRKTVKPKVEMIDLETNDNDDSSSEIVCLDTEEVPDGIPSSSNPTTSCPNESEQEDVVEPTPTISPIMENEVEEEEIQIIAQRTFPKKTSVVITRRRSQKRQKMDQQFPPPCVLDGLNLYLNNRFPSSNITRRWVVVPQDLSRINCTPSVEFTICSYNVLCQETTLSTSYLYRHTINSDWLNWERRWPNFIREIQQINADIFGMQEVQDDHFIGSYTPFFKNGGYAGLFKQKSGTKRDGCAIFYKSEMFDVLDYLPLDYFVSSSATSNRENVGQIVVFRAKANGALLIVANTHLIFNEERGDVKISQLAILFANLFEVRTKHIIANVSPSIILLGDFNIEPYSSIYDFIKNGKIHVANEYVRTLSGQSKREGGAKIDYNKLIDKEWGIGMDCVFKNRSCNPKNGNISHPFVFKSVYNHGETREGEREISTYHKDKANPDFMFYTENEKNQLVLTHRYQLPLANHLEILTPWPNFFVPSDHIPLLARFKLSN
ncbi:unnamed protein product [Caenorhabditis angaria]|uniref:Endonuclease/exonuclease/phosphatase domain-containing protein n=1 Tax=Caenorhabditis angaria TaxID=860376 RepID=A0A9P1IYX7_9PELO|nr:unnamed protein product [Caenorhabditis angaria]